MSQAGHDEAVDDALALRLAAIEAADVVFRVAHQLHGATGFCDETHPVVAFPIQPAAAAAAAGTVWPPDDALTAGLGRRGLTGLFNDDAVAP